MTHSDSTIAVSSRSARKLWRPRGAYLLRLVLSLSNAGGNVVSYRLKVIDPRKPLDPLALKSGDTTAGTVSSALRVRPTRSTRILQLRIDANDPVGNKATLATSLRLK